MAKSTRGITKKRQRKKRPPKAGTPVVVRLQDQPLKQLDSWRSKQDGKPSRPEAIRQLIEIVLGSEKPK
jgi:hypothetical protein